MDPTGLGAWSSMGRHGAEVRVLPAWRCFLRLKDGNPAFESPAGFEPAFSALPSQTL